MDEYRAREWASRLAGDTPDVSGLPCDRIVSADGTDVMYRFTLRHSPVAAERIHHIMASDPGRDYHDHPWDFMSWLLSGVYIEHTPHGETVYRAPCVIWRQAEQLHRLELPEGPVWSRVRIGRLRRRWGFQTPRGWVRWDRYPAAGQVTSCADSDGREW